MGSSILDLIVYSILDQIVNNILDQIDYNILDQIVYSILDQIVYRILVQIVNSLLDRLVHSILDQIHFEANEIKCILRLSRYIYYSTLSNLLSFINIYIYKYLTDIILNLRAVQAVRCTLYNMDCEFCVANNTLSVQCTVHLNFEVNNTIIIFVLEDA